MAAVALLAQAKRKFCQSAMNVAIIVAAGAGQRMGGECPKQFLNLCGEPVLIHTLRAFERCQSVDQIVVVLPQQHQAEAAKQLSAAGFNKIVSLIPGGPERQDSVWNGLQAIDATQTQIVVIHDGVRPLVTEQEITAVIAEARATGAAVIGYPVTDTLKEVHSGRIIKTVDRRRFYLVQTPQAFRVSIILKAYQQALADGFRATDDASLVERSEHVVTVVQGSRQNIKITWPEDLALAEFWLNRRRGG
ncbi:MAG: 2-C-methyl-D-erythritol 4-phosphate cytidylyltransferase [Acidobacteriota bacterium]|nr:2-C-methyl-D-erythritol 4-phosphate cytidylyltransferase [Acidobacteriota bacterium]